jgi:AcrR family transcriptional regulator
MASMNKRTDSKPRKEPSQPRSIATVEAVMRATAHILEHEGFDALSTNRVARKAGVSIGSLYQYFPNKESLITELAERHSKEVLARLTEAFVGLGDASLEDAVRILIRGNVDAHTKTVALHRILSDEVGRPAHAKDSIEIHGAAMVRAVLDRHRERLRVKDIALAAYLLSHAVESVVHAVVLGTRSPASVDVVVEELAAMVIRYLVDPAAPPPAPRHARKR